MKYIYEIHLDSLKDESLIGDSGDEIFDTEEEAREDAEAYAEDLAIDYQCDVNDLDICIFESDNEIGPFKTYKP